MPHSLIAVLPPLHGQLHLQNPSTMLRMKPSTLQSKTIHSARRPAGHTTWRRPCLLAFLFSLSTVILPFFVLLDGPGTP